MGREKAAVGSDRGEGKAICGWCCGWGVETWEMAVYTYLSMFISLYILPVGRGGGGKEEERGREPLQRMQEGAQQLRFRDVVEAVMGYF